MIQRQKEEIQIRLRQLSSSTYQKLQSDKPDANQTYQQGDHAGDDPKNWQDSLAATANGKDQARDASGKSEKCTQKYCRVQH